MVMPYHLHMPSYFLETFTEYPELYVPLSLHTININLCIMTEKNLIPKRN